MRILIIRLKDKNKIVDFMKITCTENLEFFYSDDIKTAINDINFYNIDIFVVDAKTNFTSLKKFTSEVDYYMDNCVKGVLSVTQSILKH
ncbi:MAG: hypothetical protein R3Y35_14870 [Clostridia bacterium]